ncbi:hypothetical protein AQUCO_00200401v1 [Aquilegia coerulea]|uniref:Protein SHORT HYPOCOTYL IN WHITE LIGHT 1 n=1 Tax=Aquilegia coerulea TaxID=218851 RepID=A0A2G5F306_AQUCA|nr:hypothetical protein AQUCO_00200401v1 [Aquilegia coerulea]
MVGLASLFSSPSLLSRFSKLTHSNVSYSLSKHTFHHLIHQNRNSCYIKNPRNTIIPHAKLSSSGEAEQDLEEMFFGVDNDIAEEEESDDDEETESSLDLLFRFLQSLFKKVSKKAKKATRSILPPVIAPHLVSFAVDGVLLLTSLSIVKAFLEVVCTLGGSVFIAILVLRVIWATISHFQSTGNRFNQGGSSFNQGGSSYGSAQPVT